ncbi:hypothetical protein [Chryseobacterium sp. YR221]|uniref:hypothetical protein n=1 Tax=Chryseobacterium sp. YR221 TaxID=1500293 RepID=UPI0009D872C4|nr:hypothetical protein [Chryseobacterium sp. YR221]SMC40544.1 hypothetical protein SAMN02787074_1050 [Chryseobacterium sp. YR221]
MLDFFDKIIELINHYGTTGILLCSFYIVYKIITASSSKWSEREQSYCILLESLGAWQNSLTDRLNYYQEPGSWHSEDPKSSSFQENQLKGVVAYENIRKQMSVSRIYLSNNSRNVVEKLLSDYWYISEHKAVCTGDYLNLTLREVQKAYDVLLNEAKKDLSKSKQLKFIQKLVSQNE